MFAPKTTARIVGVLFIVASATAIAGGSLLLPLDEPGFLSATAAAEGQIVSGVLLELVLVLSVVGIAVMIYPILRRWDEGLGMAYIGARTIEAVLLLAASVSGLVVLSLARTSGQPGDTVLALGDSVLATREWTYLIGSLVALGVSAVILNSVLFRAHLVPGWLSLWGLAGGALILLRGVMEMYGTDLNGLAQGILAAPIAIQEMVFALWLIIKGFDNSRQPLSADEEGPGLADKPQPVKEPV
jgi:hypothetical protein